MSAWERRPRRSPQVFVLLDPVQNYEESQTILGVYGSLKAAKVALRAHRRRPRSQGGQYWPDDLWRESEVQQWAGGTLLAAWRYYPEKHGLHRNRGWVALP